MFHLSVKSFFKKLFKIAQRMVKSNNLFLTPATTTTKKEREGEAIYDGGTVFLGLKNLGWLKRLEAVYFTLSLPHSYFSS